MGLDHWRFVHAEHFKVGEAGLHRSAVLEINSPVKSGRESPCDPALSLSFQSLRVDHDSAIDRADNSMNPKVVGFPSNGNVRDLCDETVFRVNIARQASSPQSISILRYRSFPPRLLGRNL